MLAGTPYAFLGIMGKMRVVFIRTAEGKVEAGVE